MKYTFKKLPESAIEIEVTLDHQEFLNYWQPEFDKALSQVHLKGFRPGTAPKEMAEKAVDKDKVFHEAVNEAVHHNLRSITEENDWQVIDQPKIEVLENNEGPISQGGTPDQVKLGLGLKYKTSLIVFPEIKLPDYKKNAAKISKSEKKEIKIEDKEIEDSIKWILNSRAKLTRVNHAAEKGNVADIDFAGTLDGKPLDGASGKADNFVLGEGKFVSGFEDNLYGKKEGDKVEFSVVFPADYWKPELRDKKVDFKVEVKGVFGREVPALTDELVKGLGKFETADDFRKNVREGLLQEKIEKEKERLRLKIMEEIIKNCKVDLPKIMLERTLDGMVAEYKEYAQATGLGKKEDDAAVRKNLEERAKNNVLTNLVIYAIAKNENLAPSKEEVEAEVNEFLKNRKMGKKEQIDPKQLYDYIYGVVQNRKVFGYLESL